MRLRSILTAAGVSSAAGLALAACPPSCDEACCAEAQARVEGQVLVELASDEDLPKLSELQTGDTRRIVRNRVQTHGDGQRSVVVKIINGEVSATVNGEEIDPEQINRADGRVVIKVEGQEDIVVPLGGNVSISSGFGVPFMNFESGEGVFQFAPQAEGSFRFSPQAEGRAFFSGSQPNRGIIGINISDADKELLEQLGVEGAIRIDGVIDGSPAEKAGIRANDLLVEINGNQGLNIEKLREVLSDKEPGEQVKLRVLRQGDSKTFTVELAPANRGASSGGGRVIELAPDVDLDIEGIVEGLQSKDFPIELKQELHNKLKNLHVELAPLHNQLQGKVYGELRGLGQGGQMMVTPRLRLHGDGQNWIFESPKGGEGGTLKGSEGDLDARLSDLSERLDRLEQRLDRLARALEKE